MRSPEGDKTAAWIPLSDPDIAQDDLDSLMAAARSPQLSHGPRVEAFEELFARRIGRKHAVAVASGTAGMALGMQAVGIGPGDEVIAPAFSWRETAHAIHLAGAVPVFADVDYWSGVLVPDKVAGKLTTRTRAILAGNANGHPAPWLQLAEIAERDGLSLLEDSTEAIGSKYMGKTVGNFGDISVFDFSQPSALSCGEGGMVVTDDDETAERLRGLRHRRPADRRSLVAGSRVPHQSCMSELSAALGIAQLRRLDAILERRKRVESLYFDHVKSFEGIKDPYQAPEADAVHWSLYLVHMGTRFTRSSCESILEDLRREGIDAHFYSHPLHIQRFYIDLDPANRRGRLPVTERLADRAIALPFHGHLREEQIAFIASTLKDASVNVGAGSAIYL